MSFEKQARSRAQGLIEALAGAAQKEMDALRAAVEARTGALHKALSHADQAGVLDRLVQELAGAAKEEAEAFAGKVRAEVQQQAEAALAAGRAELDRTRQELEKRLAEAQKAHAALAGTLAEAQKETTAARSERDAQKANFAQAQERVRPLEQERKQLLSAQEEANKLLEREAKRATLLAADLDLARKELEAAKGQAQARGKESDTANVQLERVGAALRSINAATSAGAVFETLVEHLAKYFNKTIVFQVGPSGVKAWLGRGFGNSTDVSKVAIPGAIDAVLKRTLADRKVVTVVRGKDGPPPKGLSDSPIGSAVALPVITTDRVIAIAYAEVPEGTSAATWDVGCKVGEILIDHVSWRLTTKRPASASDAKT